MWRYFFSFLMGEGVGGAENFLLGVGEWGLLFFVGWGVGVNKIFFSCGGVVGA